MKKKIIVLLFIIILGSIFWLSNKDASASNVQSNTLLVKLGVVTEEQMKENTPYVQKMKSLIRNLAHFTIYYVLGGVTFLIFVIVLKQKKYVIFSAMLFLLIYAILDEIHQYFVPGRSFQFIDIRTDFVGGMLGILTVAGIYKVYDIRSRQKNGNEQSNFRDN